MNRPAIITVLTTINKLLIATPMITENPTNPSLYSFFQGLKKVLNKDLYPSWWIINNRTNFRMLKTSLGLSKNHQVRKVIGRLAI